MLTIWFIMLMGYMCPRGVTSEVYFVRVMGRENPSNYELTEENELYMRELNTYLCDWHEKRILINKNYEEEVIRPEELLQ